MEMYRIVAALFNGFFLNSKIAYKLQQENGKKKICKIGLILQQD